MRGSGEDGICFLSYGILDIGPVVMVMGWERGMS
jgi:hypothetical protein